VSTEPDVRDTHDAPNDENGAGAPWADIERLAAVDVEVSGVLGEAVVPLADLLSWLPGVIVPLDRAVGQPADLRVEGTTVASAEIVAVDERYGLRILGVIAGAPARAVRARRAAS